MNNFQKISSAVVIFGLLGLGACVSSQPKKEEPCIALIPKLHEVCGDQTPNVVRPDLPSDYKRVPSELLSPESAPAEPAPAVPTIPAVPDTPVDATPVPVEETPAAPAVSEVPEIIVEFIPYTDVTDMIESPSPGG